MAVVEHREETAASEEPEAEAVVHREKAAALKQPEAAGELSCGQEAIWRRPY